MLLDGDRVAFPLVSRTICATTGAWLASVPTLRILAMQQQGCVEKFLPDAPRLLNVIDLGDGRTGLILNFDGEDGRGLRLIEYRDGLDVADMPLLQSISFGA